MKVQVNVTEIPSAYALNPVHLNVHGEKIIDVPDELFIKYVDSYVAFKAVQAEIETRRGWSGEWTDHVNAMFFLTQAVNDRYMGLVPGVKSPINRSNNWQDCDPIPMYHLLNPDNYNETACGINMGSVGSPEIADDRFPVTCPSCQS